ncbi:MAG TPA: hypothetical protein VGP13_00440 [Candidatus Paceibacterota bacterium]|jgi:hypothetical protein|nr:hypothetical protein [Candidatus Paceibacterota bacterium]
MKVTIGIIIVLLIALGVWLSLTAGHIEPSQQAGQTASSTPAGWVVYSDAAGRFSVSYPQGYSANGAVFTIPASLYQGTNLSSDTSISVVDIPQGQDCKDASSTDAGAGNRYEETVFATPIASGCLAVRYFVHYGAIENYPQDAVREFDRQALLAQFDAIRATLVVR